MLAKVYFWRTPALAPHPDWPEARLTPHHSEMTRVSAVNARNSFFILEYPLGSNSSSTRYPKAKQIWVNKCPATIKQPTKCRLPRCTRSKLVAEACCIEHIIYQLTAHREAA